MYGQDSWSWELNSRWFPLIGGPRAAILQVCDPKVAAGVASFSTYRTDPLGRLERTLDAMLAIGFGSPERRAATLEGLERGHRMVRGTTADGEPYRADEPELMYWVLATLVDTVLEVERRYVGRLRERDRAEYFEESKLMADAFGVPSALVPADLDAFRGYMATRIAELEPSADSVAITRSLMRPGLRYLPDQTLVPLNWVTTELLPRRLRRLLGLADLNPAELAAVRGARAVSRTTLPHLRGPIAANPFNGRAIRGAA
jgi:uncharacterized protein (DUF2236 family)